MKQVLLKTEGGNYSPMGFFWMSLRPKKNFFVIKKVFSFYRLDDYESPDLSSNSETYKTEKLATERFDKILQERMENGFTIEYQIFENDTTYIDTEIMRELFSG